MPALSCCSLGGRVAAHHAEGIDPGARRNLLGGGGGGVGAGARGGGYVQSAVPSCQGSEVKLYQCATPEKRICLASSVAFNLALACMTHMFPLPEHVCIHTLSPIELSGVNGAACTAALMLCAGGADVMLSTCPPRNPTLTNTRNHNHCTITNGWQPAQLNTWHKYY